MTPWIHPSEQKSFNFISLHRTHTLHCIVHIVEHEQFRVSILLAKNFVELFFGFREELGRMQYVADNLCFRLFALSHVHLTPPSSLTQKIKLILHKFANNKNLLVISLLAHIHTFCLHQKLSLLLFDCLKKHKRKKYSGQIKILIYIHSVCVLFKKILSVAWTGEKQHSVWRFLFFCCGNLILK